MAFCMISNQLDASIGAGAMLSCRASLTARDINLTGDVLVSLGLPKLSISSCMTGPGTPEWCGTLPATSSASDTEFSEFAPSCETAPGFTGRRGGDRLEVGELDLNVEGLVRWRSSEGPLPRRHDHGSGAALRRKGETRCTRYNVL
jgi:hypothetical protein